MPSGDQRKTEYFARSQNLFKTYSKVLICSVDNVTSNQLHQVRSALRGKAIVLMGKNTLIRKSMREILAECPKIEVLFPYIKGNVGLVFTNEDLKTIGDIVTSNRIAAPAKLGAIAPCTVKIPAGPTSIAPDKTQFFQALGINTKINKGLIEIISDITLITPGQKVGASEAQLLTMLNVKPFSYGLNLEACYDDGTIFEPSLLSITEEEIIKSLASTANTLTALSLEVNIPTTLAVPHMLLNAFKNLLALTMESEVSFPLADKFKSAAATAAVAVSASPAKAAAPKAAAAKEEVKEEESDEEMGFGLFD